ncbi:MULTISPECIES: hypothetical protein [Kitasatospora]|uniref:Cysteine synthase n=2 Tax=Kitasatospora TaxID=2063 RepID=A0ABT1JB89_9ACTN|nr:hypothetical protein [Kitasatospora paracochleata]MCP2314643.1 cysteine synthase [Kitasatospora paracochleata]
MSDLIVAGTTAASGVGLAYAASLLVAALTAVLAPSADRRADARQALSLLLSLLSPRR